jgi:hypothetical protein
MPHTLARRGLTLSRRALRRLHEVGIFAQSTVSLEHQHLAKRYVVRGIESGGAVKDIGRYVTFCGPDGEPLPYLHPLDAIGVNGVHAVVVAPVLVRIDLFRIGRTYQLIISKHQPVEVQSGTRPLLESNVLFRGFNGFHHVDIVGNKAVLSGSNVPQFWSRAGEKVEVPAEFNAAVRAAVNGASCIGCKHAHYLTVSVGVVVGGSA